jgi:hypothetical protein
LPENSPPVLLPVDIEITRKSKPVVTVLSNGTIKGDSNGTKRKRSMEEVAGLEIISKREKLQASKDNGDVVAIDDSGDGAILIDD